MPAPISLRRALAALVLAVLPVVAWGQWWNTTRPPPPRTGNFPVPAAATKVEYTREIFLAAGSSTSAFLANEKFADLERMYAEFLSGGLRAKEGSWMVEAVQGGLDGVYSSWDDTYVKGMHAKWAAAVPDSKLRPLAEAIRWQRRAWDARGGRGASEVPGESFRLFRTRLETASKALADAEPDGHQSPLWYWVALIVAGSSGLPAPQFDALYEEAAKHFPTYHTIHYTRMNYLLPQWGGSYEAVDRFVNGVVERTAATEGQAMYAWLYIDVARKHNGDFFGETRVSWPKMKKGFEDMVERHPDAWNRNLFATFACRARDKETTARLITELGPAARLGAWSPGFATDSCRRFAFTPT